MDAAGFVLTGGFSTRMGTDKALLPMYSQTLCEHVGDIVRTVATPVFLVGHPERYVHLKYECIPDLRPGLGPLSGLEAALALGICEYYVIASCDAANLRGEWLAALLRAAETGSLCAVAEDEAGIVQPLCAVYRSECRATISRAISENRLRMMDLVEELGATKVRVHGVASNLNTPEDYANSRE